jgi:CRP-like cAMP-binding protein
MGLSPAETEECSRLLAKSVLFRHASEAQLKEICKQAHKRQYKKGDILAKEGDPQSRMFVIQNGSIVREKVIGGQVHLIDTQMGGNTVGSLHVMTKDPVYATAKCVNETTTYEFDSELLNRAFRQNPDLASGMLYSLTMEIRRHTKTMRTPLLEQTPKKTNYAAVTVAAGMESFYRSALNSWLNQQLTGVKMISLFPNMHIQIPTRIVYINGFKGLRAFFDTKVHSQEWDNPQMVRLGAAVAPGLCMTPMSSILEACNAGHSNPEPLWRRWTRGIVPRAGREVIFGVGLNQLSDYCEERVPAVIENPALRNAAGSLSAGVMSGYMSHVVHNMSTLKLMNPNKTYMTHFKEYVKKSEKRLPATIPASVKGPLAVAMACIFPIGVHIRTSQIVGSFIILNGTINAMQKYNFDPLRMFLGK